MNGSWVGLTRIAKEDTPLPLSLGFVQQFLMLKSYFYTLRLVVHMKYSIFYILVFFVQFKNIPLFFYPFTNFLRALRKSMISLLNLRPFYEFIYQLWLRHEFNLCIIIITRSEGILICHEERQNLGKLTLAE